MPPEDTDSTSQQPSALPPPPQPVGINPQQASPPQYPPIDAQQNTTPTVPPAKTFPTKKLLIGIVVILVITLIASVVGLHFYSNQKKQTSATIKSVDSNQSSLSEKGSSLIERITGTGSKNYQACFEKFDEQLLPQQLRQYKRNYKEIIEPIAQDINSTRLGAKKRTARATYLPSKEEEQNLQIKITEFKNHDTIDFNQNQLNKYLTNLDSEKYIYFTKETINGIDIYISEVKLPPDGMYTALAVISQIPNTNVKVEFETDPVGNGIKTPSQKEGKTLFTDWLKIVCG